MQRRDWLKQDNMINIRLCLLNLMTWIQPQFFKSRGHCGCKPGDITCIDCMSSPDACTWPGHSQDMGLAAPVVWPRASLPCRVQAGMSNYFHNLQSSLYSPCLLQPGDTSFACNAFSELTLLNPKDAWASPPAWHRVLLSSSDSVMPLYLEVKYMFGYLTVQGFQTLLLAWRAIKSRPANKKGAERGQTFVE